MKTLRNVAQKAPDNILQKIILRIVVLILLDNIAQVNTVCNVVLETQDSNAQGKFCSVLP